MLQRQMSSQRQVESEGILRMLLLALALAMPLASLIYLQVQKSRMSYEMGELMERIHKEEEVQRKLMLERSRFQRDEEVQGYANRSGLQPRKQAHVVSRGFTTEDQKLARFRPVSSEEILR
jgi:cell division protein FtsL